jgi:hypothetical protein
MPSRRVMTIGSESKPSFICVEVGYGDSFFAHMKREGIDVGPVTLAQPIPGECFSVVDQSQGEQIKLACATWQARPQDDFPPRQ